MTRTIGSGDRGQPARHPLKVERPSVDQAQVRLSIKVADYAARAVPRRMALRIQRSTSLTKMVRGTFAAFVPDAFEAVEVAAGPLAGTRLVLDLQREKHLWAGTFEPWVQQTITDHLRRNGVAWDVGAHVGYHALLMHRICGPGRVVAVEPDLALVDRLEANCRLNHALGLVVVAAAAAPQRASGMVTLDSLLERHEPPHLVKIDVSGAEADALSGARKLLTVVRPLVLVELHGAAGLHALELLHDAGYRTRAIDRPDDVIGALRSGHDRHVLAEPA